jgi:DNA polymerase III subunit gamma/tau
MTHIPLTAKYRPQRFSDVAGQETARAILSRAAAEDKIAPAYLFSGTRGVGKTTMARILAKAVNCVNAPGAEPCNECAHCRHITQGSSVDVVEIDAASHGGVDHARSLKEDVGYAPMECRYKVFIIDEAHMLSTAAFNALLKTLEEPPRNVTFVLATTEPHKFPATIVSRCQHFAFKRLPLPGLEAHLKRILDAEGVEYEASAVNLLARRAAGSVRDAMSLLGQVLALGASKLEAGEARRVLGLAGNDVFLRILEGVRDRDCVAISTILREILDEGLDLGFFLRELANVWRTLFLLRQAGDKAESLLDASDDEIALWHSWANEFGPSHIHACWQLTLEGQRRVLTSLEPALALELLLLNLAYLPELLSLEQISGQGTPGQGTPRQGQQSGERPEPRRSTPPPPRSAPPSQSAQSAQPAQPAHSTPQPSPAAPAASTPPELRTAPPPREQAPPAPRPDSIREEAAHEEHRKIPSGPKSWEGFLRHIQHNAEGAGSIIHHLKQCQGEFADGVLSLQCTVPFAREALAKPINGPVLQRLAQGYFSEDATVTITEQASGPGASGDTSDGTSGGPSGEPSAPLPTPQEVRQRPLVREIEVELGASLVPNSIKNRSTP